MKILSEPSQSLKYTKINMMLSLSSYVIFCLVMRFTIQTNSDIYKQYYDIFYWTNIFLFVFTIILTVSLLYFENIFWFCCSCFLEAKEELYVHDPDHLNRTFKLVGKEIVEIHEETELRSGLQKAVSILTTPALSTQASLEEKSENIEVTEKESS